MKYRYKMIKIVMLLVLISKIASKSEMTFKIQPKDSEDIQERIVNDSSFHVRADSNNNYFLIFFDKDPNECDQQAYINVSAEKGSHLKIGNYEETVGEDTPDRTNALLDFYYTEPNGLRFHCLDNQQKGIFSIQELDFNDNGEVKIISIEFEIHCIVKGVIDKRGVKGILKYYQNNSESTELKFLE